MKLGGYDHVRLVSCGQLHLHGYLFHRIRSLFMAVTIYLCGGNVQKTMCRFGLTSKTQEPQPGQAFLYRYAADDLPYVPK